LMFLLDAMVVSELVKQKRHPAVAAWIRAQDARSLHLSVLTLGEIERGIALLQRRDGDRASALRLWLDQTIRRFHERILGVDAGISRRWGRLAAELGHAGADLLIAASALERGFTVVTRNVRHFERAGVALLNPYELA
jgi:toxin FitB